ncbi:MAG: hypothetical protein HY335_08980 [Deinococcus sp.]|nr:hypothetical protein [Deinococcus sp.]
MGKASQVTEFLVNFCAVLAIGLLTKHAVSKVMQQWARGTRFRLPAICVYAAAGTIAFLFKLLVLQPLEAPTLARWIAVGLIWGLAAGLLAPFAKRSRRPA